MRILLVQAPLGRAQAPVMPLGLAFVAAAVGREHRTWIHDPNVEPDGRLHALLGEVRPDVVGISLRNIDTTQVADPYCYYAHFPPFVRWLREVVGTEVPLIVGGPGFSLFGAEIMRRVPQLDLGVVGEGEVAFPALLQRLDDPATVPGVLVRRDGEVRLTGPPASPSLEDLRPRLDLLDVDRYRPFERNHAVGLQTQRGCALRCSYCTYGALSAPALRHRPVEVVLDELEVIVRRLGVGQVIFADSIFDGRRDHARAVCEGILRRELRVRWRAYVHLRDLDVAYLRLLVRAGCCELTFSPDAWSDRSLAALGKGITTEDITRSLDLVDATPGARANYNFFAGLPGQSADEVDAIHQFGRRARRVLGDRLVGFRVGAVRVEPGTPLHRQLVERGAVPRSASLLPESDEEVSTLFWQHTRFAVPGGR